MVYDFGKDDIMTLDYSIIVPAFNEEKRITGFLNGLAEVVKKNKTGEIIVVDDGSTDKTLEVLAGFSKQFSNKAGLELIRIISYKPNKGKGWAVRKGMLSSRAGKIIFMDADGATPSSEVPRMLELLDKHDIVIGTRSSNNSHVSEPPHRSVPAWMFNKMVEKLFHLGVRDCLCGFKGFSGDIGRSIADRLVSTGWEFDVEILSMAKAQNLDIFEQPIKWHYVKGSKISLLKDPARLFLRLLSLKRRLKKEA